MCWPVMQALFGTCSAGQLAGAFETHIALLKEAGGDAPGQVAHLVALEYLLSQRLPPSEVRGFLVLTWSCSRIGQVRPSQLGAVV